MLPEKVFNEKIFKIILSGRANSDMMYERAEILRNGQKYQSSMYTAKQVFHGNHDAAGVREFLTAHFGAFFLHYTAWDGEYVYAARVSKKGKVLTTRKKMAVPMKSDFVTNSFNRQKNHIIREGDPIPALVDMGVFTKELKIAAPMRDKFHQINRFLELIADETKTLPPETTVNIIDFGCGKSYLTFVVYHYFNEIRHHNVNICGLDISAEIVSKCAAAAKKYGYNNLSFIQGDIAGQTAPPIKNWAAPDTFSIVISLHACDTATDHALFNAVRWGADLICAVPCCQHELRSQINPQTLKLFSSYGLIEERMAALSTDAIRAKILETFCYKVAVIEFTGFAHTPKNLLIRARKTREENHVENTRRMSELRAFLKEFSFEPTLLNLLNISLNE